MSQQKAKEFLVFYESDEAGEDELNLGVHSRRRLHSYDVEADLEVTFDNKPSGLGVVGLVVSLLSFLVGAIAWVLFLLNYPDSWFQNSEPTSTSLQILVTAVGIVSTTGMVLGTLLTIIGRKVTANATLDDVHLVDLGAQ